MESVGISEVENHLSRLLDRVARGERITIEKQGVPVARLEPVLPFRRRPAAEVIAELKAFRKRHRLEGLTIREMIEEGRR